MKLGKPIKLTVVQRKYFYIVLIIIFSLLFGMGVGQFTNVIDRLFREQTSELLQQTSQNQKLLFETTFQRQTETLQLIANRIIESDYTGEQAQPILQTIQVDSGFDALGLISQDGKAYMHDGQPLSDSVQLNLRTMLQEYQASKSMMPAITSVADTIVVAIPIMSNTQFQGLLFGTSPVRDVILHLQSPSFSGQSFGYVINQEGTVIASFNNTKVPNGENYAATMTDVELNNEKVSQLTNEQLVVRPSGTLTYTRDEAYIAYYEPLGINDWTIISVAPESVFMSLAKTVHWHGAWLTAQMLLVFGVFTLFIITEHQRSEQQIQKQLDWAKLNEMKYKIALEQSDTMIVEYVVSTNEFDIAPTTLTMIGLDTAGHYTPASFQALGCFSDKIAAEWENLFAQIRAGEARVSLTIPIKFPYKTAEWYEIYFTTIFDENQLPQRAIGKLVNVHAQHQHMAQLIANAQKDSLTGIYNKGTTQSLISGILEHQPEAMHALFLIDIDDFKYVNDEFGHQVGDRVICEVAQFLTKTCRDTDIVGRIGGDEFIIFLKDIHKPEIITRKAEQICEAFQNYYLHEHQHKISGSVGVALAPTHSRDFASLYELADQAMYQVKKTGKDRWQMALADGQQEEQT